MGNLSTDYMGLRLKNPLIAGASALAKTVEGVEQLARAGAGAVVLKSLFEEEVRDRYSDTRKSLATTYGHPDAMQYLMADLAGHYGPEEYLRLVENATRAVDIPVIASVNCVDPSTWKPFARQLQAVSAQALELNVYSLPLDPRVSSDEVDNTYLDALQAVQAEVSIPVALKLSPYVSNLTRLANRLSEAGAQGLVLFNRFFHPDIDIENQEWSGGLTLSQPGDHLPSQRWLALLYGRLRCDLCASTGVHDGATLIRMLLAGARAVQITSLLYRSGLESITGVLQELESWMDRHHVDSMGAMTGKLSRAHSQDLALLERGQFIRAFVRAE